jgi:hypothetical protein
MDATSEITGLSFTSSGTLYGSAQLEQLLSDANDLVLVFDGDKVVPGHSQILRQWSGVLAGVVDGCCSKDNVVMVNHGSCNLPRIPMSGTKKEDWLAAMAFAYPVMPAADVTWENLEVSSESIWCTAWNIAPVGGGH